MSWITDRVNREKDSHKRLGEQSAKTYEDLWKEIAERVEEANTHGVPAFLDSGSGFSRRVGLTRKGGEPKMLTVRLSKDGSAIQSSGGVTLELDAGTDPIRLKHDGRQVSIQDAGKLILEPFLFG